jgi:hypothetical protein
LFQLRRRVLVLEVLDLAHHCLVLLAPLFLLRCVLLVLRVQLLLQMQHLLL